MGLKFRRGTTAQKSGSLAFGEPYVNTDLGTLQIGGATGDITLGSSGTGSTGAFGAISGSGLDITGNANIAGNLTLGGAITIGDASADTVNVIASLSSSLIPQTTNAFDLGSATKIWRDLYISTGSIKIVNPGTGTVVGTISSNSDGTQTFNTTINANGGVLIGNSVQVSGPGLGIGGYGDRLMLGTSGSTGMAQQSLIFTNTSESKAFTFPNANGTIALTSDLTAGYVTLGTTQTISGSKTFNSNNIFNGAQSITGSLIVSGSSYSFGNIEHYGTVAFNDISNSMTPLYIDINGTVSVNDRALQVEKGLYFNHINIDPQFGGSGPGASSSGTTISGLVNGYSVDLHTGFYMTASVNEPLQRNVTFRFPINSASFYNGLNFTYPDKSGTFALTSDFTELTSSLIPATSNTYDLGSPTKIWRDIYVSTGSIKIINPGTGTVVGTITSNANGDINTGTQNVSGSLNVTGSITPGATNTYDLGSPTKQFRHLYISTGSVYMNGVAILSSNATDLTLTTDAGQSLKLLETAADTITLQTAEGNLTLTSTGAGDVILDPNTGVVSIKGTLQVQDGNKITSSGGNTIQFGNNVAITGSLTTTTGLTVGGNLIVNGTTTQIDSTTLNIGDNIINLNGTGTTNGGIYVRDAAGGNTVTGSMLWDTTNDKWIAGPLGSELGILRTGGDGVVSGSSQITYASISSIPAGIVSGSSQTIANLPTGTVSGSSQITAASTTGFATGVKTQLDANTVVSGSGQINVASTTGDIALGTRTSGNYVASLVAGTNITLSNNSGEGATPTIGLTNNSTTIGTTAIALGASSTTLAGLTSVSSTGFTGALTGNASTATTLETARTINGTSFNGSANITIANLVSGSAQIDGSLLGSNKTITVGSTSITLGGTATTIAGLTSVSSTGFTGALTGNASTATTLQTARAINGVNFDGSAAITVTAAAGTLSGATLASGVTASSLTSVGTLTSLTVTGAITANGGVAVTGALTATGDITAYYSDGRLKENLQVIPNALEKVSKLTGYTYNTNALGKQLLNNENDNDIKVGVIAQDLQEVLPQAVKFAPFDRDAEGNSKSGENYLTVQYEKIVPLLIQAIKEQQTQIHSLTLEIEKLKESKGL